MIIPCAVTSGDHLFSRGRCPDGILAAERMFEGPSLRIGRMKVGSLRARSGRRRQ
jgi:hypothetical protein